MQRRSLLALIVTGLGGCTEPSDTPPRTVIKTVIRTNPPTPTPQPTTHATALKTRTATPSPTPATTPPTTTPTPGIPPEVQAVNDQIEDIQAIIAAMLQEYARFSPTSSILGVTAQSQSFTPARINGLAGDAQTILANTTPETQDQEQMLAWLDEVVLFLRFAAFSQSGIVASFANLTAGKNAAFRSEHDDAEDRRQDAEDDRIRAFENFVAILQRTSVEATASTPALSAEEYTAKIEQFAQEINSLSDSGEFLADFVTADRSLEEETCSGARDAAREFDNVQDTIQATSVYASIEPLANELRTEASIREGIAEDKIQELCN